MLNEEKHLIEKRIWGLSDWAGRRASMREGKAGLLKIVILNFEYLKISRIGFKIGLDFTLSLNPT